MAFGFSPKHVQEYNFGNSKEEDILSKPPSTSKEKITNFFSIFLPTKEYFVTPILININILIFIAMILSGVHFLLPENQSLLEWGANFRPLTLAGQWWRLFSAIFLHIGVLHLLLNMYALLYIGLLLEPYLGKTRFLAAYLISGIAASVTSLCWHDITISAGASGAIFGMYGVFLALLTTNLLDKSVKNALLASIAAFVGYNILNGLKPDSGIDNAAHIGGLISGFITGYAFVPSLKKYENTALKSLTIGILSVVLLLSSFIVYKSLPNDIGKYDEKMNTFFALESMALEVYSLPENTPKEKILYELKEKGIYYWNENLKLIESLNDLNLPQQIIERNVKLKKYCELRIKSYELIYKAISEDTDEYQLGIIGYNEKIEKIIKEITEEQ
jgi:rhomboid protease GluP